MTLRHDVIQILKVRVLFVSGHIIRTGWLFALAAVTAVTTVTVAHMIRGTNEINDVTGL